MSEYNGIDCCFDCAKQFNDALCSGYCRDRESCEEGYCTPGGCGNEFVTNKNLYEIISDIKNDKVINLTGMKRFDELYKVISMEEYEELLEFKEKYLELCK